MKIEIFKKPINYNISSIRRWYGRSIIDLEFSELERVFIKTTIYFELNFKK